MRLPPKLETNPWKDIDCISSFIERNCLSFLDFCVEEDAKNGFAESKSVSIKFCEKKMSSFLDFADNYYEES